MATKDKRGYQQSAQRYDAMPDSEAAPASDKARRIEATRLNKVFGERMYRARQEINGWTQLQAAKLLGYATSSPLAKIEAGGKFPLWLPTVASRVYRVTTDYLLGVADVDYEVAKPGTEWEKDIVNASAGHLKILMEEHAKFLKSVAKTTSVTVDGTASLIQASSAAREAFDWVRQHNPSLWEEARGGARLERAMDDLHRACVSVRADATRARVSLRATGCNAGVADVLTQRLDF